MDGLIHALKFDGRGGAAECPADSYVSGEGTHWLHLDYTRPEAARWLRERDDIDPVIVESLLMEETRPRTFAVDDGLLLALRGVNLNPGSDPEDMVSIRLWIRGNLIISTRARRLLSITNIVSQLKNGTGPETTAGFLLQLMEQLVDRINDTVNNLEDDVDTLEERIIEGDVDRAARTDLSGLRRQIIAIRRYLSPQREAFTRIAAEHVSWLGTDDRIMAREITDRLVRQIEDLDAVRDRATVTHEELAARVSEQTNNRMYLLSIVAAIFLPLGFLTGLLGVNVGGIPGAENPYAFLLFAVGLTVLIVVQIIYFRWNRWL